MKKLNKGIALVLSLVMALSVMCVSAFAEGEEQDVAEPATVIATVNGVPVNSVAAIQQKLNADGDTTFDIALASDIELSGWGLYLPHNTTVNFTGTKAGGKYTVKLADAAFYGYNGDGSSTEGIGQGTKLTVTDVNFVQKAGHTGNRQVVVAAQGSLSGIEVSFVNCDFTDRYSTFYANTIQAAQPEGQENKLSYDGCTFKNCYCVYAIDDTGNGDKLPYNQQYQVTIADNNNLAGAGMVRDAFGKAAVGNKAYSTLAAAVEAAAANDTVTLLDDVVLTDTLAINKNITLDGDDHTISGNVGGSSSDKKSFIKVDIANDGDFTMEDCVIVPSAKIFANAAVDLNVAGKVSVTGCTFGANTDTSGYMYNGLEFSGSRAMDDTTISGNTFYGGAFRHNCISFYRMAESAVINISNNTFIDLPIESTNAARISNYDNATATVNFSGNTYNEVGDSVEGWSGFFFVQNNSSNSNNLTINVTNLTMTNGNQLAYFYKGSTGFSDFPTVNIDSSAIGKTLHDFAREITYQAIANGTSAKWVNETDIRTATFQNYDGTILQSVKFESGTAPAYTGATPSRPGSGYISYEFTGWTPAVSAATEDVTYTAQFRTIDNTPTPVYTDDDYDYTPAAPATTPTVEIEEEATPLAALPESLSDVTVTVTNEAGEAVEVTVSELPNVYADVQEESWSRDAIAYANALGLMNGVGNDENGDATFDPQGTTTSEMLTTVLFRAVSGETTSGENWADDAIAWAADANLTEGLGLVEGEAVTREQMVTMMYRIAAAKGFDVSAADGLSAFPDADGLSDFAADAMAWAVSVGLINGMDGKLNGAGEVTREQIATILMRFNEMTKTTV